MKDLENRPHLKNFLEHGVSADDIWINSTVKGLEKNLFTLQKIKCFANIDNDYLTSFTETIDCLTLIYGTLADLDKENQALF